MLGGLTSQHPGHGDRIVDPSFAWILCNRRSPLSAQPEARHFSLLKEPRVGCGSGDRYLKSR